MARDLSINQAILEDGDFAGWSPDAQRAWFILRLDPRIGVSGLGRIALPNIARTLGVTRKRATEIMAELTSAKGGLGLDYDDATGVLWFRGSFGREPNSPTIRAAAARDVLRLPDSPVVGHWFACYWPRFTSLTDPDKLDRKTLESLSSVESGYRLDGVSMGYRYHCRAAVPVPVVLRTTTPLPNPPRKRGGSPSTLSPREPRPTRADRKAEAARWDDSGRCRACRGLRYVSLGDAIDEHGDITPRVEPCAACDGRGWREGSAPPPEPPAEPEPDFADDPFAGTAP